MARRSQKGFRLKQIFILFILIMFLGGTIGGFAMFYANPGGNTPQQPQNREFVFTNVFNTSVDFATQQDAIRPVNNPQQYPDVPMHRKLGGVWIEYACDNNCPELVSQLRDLVSKYEQRVYISPADRNETLYLQAFQDTEYLDEADMPAAESFICNNLIAPPDICALQAVTDNTSQNTSNTHTGQPMPPA